MSQFLGELMGSVAGVILALLGWILAWLVAWGFWSDRILTKAGFRGGTWRLLFSMLNLPVLVGIPLGAVSNYEMQEVIGSISALSVWLALMIVAIAPWPVRRPPQPPKPTAARKPSP